MDHFYSAIVVTLGIMLRRFALNQWEAFKAREALKPQEMVLKRGVYVPWGRVQKLQGAGYIVLVIWAVYILALIGLVIYVWYVLGIDHF